MWGHAGVRFLEDKVVSRVFSSASSFRERTKSALLVKNALLFSDLNENSSNRMVALNLSCLG